jgi:hypothetical protein
VNHFATPEFWFHYRGLTPEYRELADRCFRLTLVIPRYGSKESGAFGPLALAYAFVRLRGIDLKAWSGSGSVPMIDTSN